MICQNVQTTILLAEQREHDRREGKDQPPRNVHSRNTKHVAHAPLGVSPLLNGMRQFLMDWITPARVSAGSPCFDACRRKALACGLVVEYVV
jgi:hypothetical protein